MITLQLVGVEGRSREPKRAALAARPISSISVENKDEGVTADSY